MSGSGQEQDANWKEPYSCFGPTKKNPPDPGTLSTEGKVNVNSNSSLVRQIVPILRDFIITMEPVHNVVVIQHLLGFLSSV